MSFGKIEKTTIRSLKFLVIVAMTYCSQELFFVGASVLAKGYFDDPSTLADLVADTGRHLPMVNSWLLAKVDEVLTHSLSVIGALSLEKQSNGVKVPSVCPSSEYFGCSNEDLSCGPVSVLE